MRWNAFLLAVAPWLLRVAFEAVFLPGVEAARSDVCPFLHDESLPDIGLVDQALAV